MDLLIIETATLAHLEQLQKLSITTFTETFAEVNTAENLQKYLDKSFNKGQLTAELNDKNSHFFIAFSNEIPVGYAKINVNTAQTEQHNLDAMELHRIYVLQEFHGKKVAQKLFEKVLKIAQKKEVPQLWLGVWEENKRALQFYKNNGFTIFDQHDFWMGDDKQTDLLLQRTP